MYDKYILDGKSAVECADVMKWAAWFEENKSKRHVADEHIGDVRVSTVFLGLDHSFGGGVPLLFETMVFGGALAEEQERCTTWEQAETMHKNMVERVKAEGSFFNGAQNIDARFLCSKCGSGDVMLSPMFGSVSRCQSCGHKWANP